MLLLSRGSVEVRWLVVRWCRRRGGGDVGDEMEMVECGSSGCCRTVAEVADGVDMVVVTAGIWPEIWPDKMGAPE
ncbi:hypothetical protein Tco_0811870 [Tanacetum coccineum]|uniref:Uncharacterized protein n=1 Tax=Tanacetum coccineum TaxID=301880 RepID=A0ABQ5IW83_9ASTR